MKNFRIIISRIVEYFLMLVGNIIAKHTADGESSKLNVIDMATMESLYDEVVDLHDLAIQLDKDKEKAIELRNHALGIEEEQNSFTPNTVLFYLSAIRDHLLGVFKGLERTMGDYGFEVNSGSKGKGVVVIPRSPIFMIRLGKSILAKHAADGAGSTLNEFDMVAFADLMQEAENQDKLARELNNQKEKAFEHRNFLLGFGKGQRRITPGTLLYFVVSVRDVLKAQFRGLEQSLGDWGFEVNTYLPPNTNPDPDPIPIEPAVITGVVRIAHIMDTLEAVMVLITGSFGSIEVVSGSDGSFAAVMMIEEPEAIMVSVNHPGYIPFTQPMVANPGEEIAIDIALDPE